MKKVFEIPSHLMPEFSELLQENELVNEIKGKTEDDEVIVEVNYRSEQKGEIFDLIEWFEENTSEDFDFDDDDGDNDDDGDDDNKEE